MTESGRTSDNSPAAASLAAAGDCPLSPTQQTRNILIYAANWALLYLASPVAYVGVTQATLLNRFKFSDSLANLPASVYLWMTPLPVLVAWAFPQTRSLKSLIVTAFLVMAATGAIVGGTLLTLDRNLVLAAVIVHAGVLGCFNGVMATCQWEMIGKGVAESRRGQALGLAFGFGPVLALVASGATDLLLSGAWFGWKSPLNVSFPWNFAVLYFASAPTLILGALFSSQFIVPLPATEPQRQPFVEGVFGGFGGFFGYRLILIAAIAYILVYSGHVIVQNLSLYAEQVIGEKADKFAGIQLSLRFGFKIFAGFGLGLLLIWTHPKALLLATAALSLAAILWGMWMPGHWYLISFGILGAGELFGVYYPNYILGCSPKDQMRRNMAFASLVTMPVGFAPVLYGAISDSFGKTQRTLGLQVSFAVACAILVATILLVTLALPARPRPPE